MAELCFRYLHQRRTPRNETAATSRREIAPRVLSSGCCEEGWAGVERGGREKGEESEGRSSGPLCDPAGGSSTQHSSPRECDGGTRPGSCDVVNLIQTFDQRMSCVRQNHHNCRLS